MGFLCYIAPLEVDQGELQLSNNRISGGQFVNYNTTKRSNLNKRHHDSITINFHVEENNVSFVDFRLEQCK